MHTTGIVRKLDNLGRIVLPKEMLATKHIREEDPILITLTQWERFCFSMIDFAKRCGI